MSEVATKTRIITILSPKGSPETALTLKEGLKWSELKKEVERHYSLDKMKAVESINSHTLEHPNAVVPDGDFDLYLLQLRSKSGAKAAKKAAKKAAPKKAATAKKAVTAKKAATKSATPKKAAKKGATSTATKAARGSKKAHTKEGLVDAAEEATKKPVAPPKPVETPAQKQARLRELARGFPDVVTP